MKYLIVLASIGLVGLGCQKKLDTDQNKASYAIGQQIGNSIKQQKIDVDPEVIAMAIKDAQKGENKLGPEGVKEAMTKLQESMMQKSMKEAEDNKGKSGEFLEKNKTDEGVKTTASGLQYKIEKDGTGKIPSANDTVKVHYKGTLVNGEQFDSSYDRGQPAEFPVTGVIRGWTEALQLMKVGSKYKLFIPPELAYGSAGRPGIPPNSVLIFDVELIDVVGSAKAAPSAKKKTM